ncbi:uncharacterized protein LOC117322722 [Pecten maximus]|uniref:uncharacterized protein LOC117322722 n=1 Tax=Pecten maximus TaxID=6579 RepID=UPI00145821E9|nr:uncharacterized protein LOC117322722 [Pecten maximus]
MEQWIPLGWISILLLVLAEIVSSVPILGPFNPNSSVDEQPLTFLPPPPNHNCSVYIPGTVWHFIDHIRGRCCRQIFIINGISQICDANGEWDKFADCPRGSYNRKSPFYTGQFQYPNLAQHLCQDKELAEGSSSLNISWKTQEYIIPGNTPAILSGTVYSNSKLRKAYLFRNDERLPLGQMSYGMIESKHYWFVDYTLRNPTLEDRGVYRILVINEQKSTWSGDVRLTVLPRESPTTNSPTASSTTQVTDSPDSTRPTQPTSQRPSHNVTVTTPTDTEHDFVV